MSTRGFAQWTNYMVNDSILLLDLGTDSPELANRRLEGIRYKWDGVNSMYWNGDPHSWQRYTKKIPLAIDITLTETTGTEPPRQLRISPKISLTAGGCYAIVLLHDIPIHLSSPSSSSAHDSSLPRGVAEDKLIFFQILKPEPKPPPPSLLPPPLPPPSLAFSTSSLSSQVHFSVHTHHPSHPPRDYSIALQSSTTIWELKSFISKEFSIPLSLLILSLNDLLLLSHHDSLTLMSEEANLLLHNTLRIWPSFHLPTHSLAHPNYSLDTSNILSSYLPYISSVSPSQYQLHVPLDFPITVRFQSVAHTIRAGQYHSLMEQRRAAQGTTSPLPHHKLISRSLVLSCFHHIASPLPFLATSSPLSQQKDDGNQTGDAPKTEGSRLTIQCADMRQMLGEKEAERRGYKCWLRDSDTFESTPLSAVTPASSSPTQTHRTSFPSHQRFYLIELESLEMIERDWRRVRYKYTPWASEQERSSNGFYCEGDRYSWQRYTKYLPVMGAFVINSEQQTLTFQPSLPLYPGTVYGILLANGVPSVPTSSLTNASSASSSPESEDWYSIQEDLLFVFTTTGQKKDYSVAERLRWNRQNICLQRGVEELREREEETKRQRSQEEKCVIS
jgi:hypothetical protein